MPLAVLPHLTRAAREAPPWSTLDYLRVVGWMLGRGLTTAGRGVAVATTILGGSALGYAVLAAGLAWPWALVAALALLVVVLAVGGARLYREAHAAAVRYAPTWQELQERADTLWAVDRASGGGDQALGQRQFAATHSVAALRDFDLAEQAGYPLQGIDRQFIRDAGPGQIRAIAEAFEDAATRWRADERGQNS